MSGKRSNTRCYNWTRRYLFSSYTVTKSNYITDLLRRVFATKSTVKIFFRNRIHTVQPFIKNTLRLRMMIVLLCKQFVIKILLRKECNLLQKVLGIKSSLLTSNYEYYFSIICILLLLFVRFIELRNTYFYKHMKRTCYFHLLYVKWNEMEHIQGKQIKH